MVRLRQAVLAARDLDATVAALRDALPLAEPYHDPGVAHFGLRNAVMALGDTFVEVVSPVRDDAPAARFLDRLGADGGGYMAMFQVGDLAGARARVERLGIRTVWSIDLPDISDDHLHPRDMGGTIVSLDEARPPASWRWGGEAWTARAPEHGGGGITGLRFACADPADVAARWGEVLGVPLDPARPAVALDGGAATFVEGEGGLVAFTCAADGDARDVEVAGVRFEVTAALGPSGG